MPASILRLEVHRVSEYEPGWCDACALPSAMVATFAVVNSATLRVVTRWTVTSCLDCGASHSRPPDPPPPK